MLSALLGSGLFVALTKYVGIEPTSKVGELMNLRITKKRQSISTEFERAFALEILKSDKLRISILLGSWLGVVAILFVFSWLFTEQFQVAFHGKFDGFRRALIIGSGVTLSCLVFELFAIGRLIRKEKAGVPSLRYLSAFVETSLPTLGLFLSSQFLSSIYSLATPAPFAYGIFIILSVLRLDFRLCAFTGTVAASEYFAFYLYAVNRDPTLNVEPIVSGLPQHLFKACLLLGTGLVAGLVTIQIKQRILRSFETIAERNRISRTFGEYVSPAVMDTLLDLKPDLRSENKNVCVMFLDIRDFTSFAEKRTPEEVVTYLESLFEFMIEIINRHNGIINKFLGDGFMAVFGAPIANGHDCSNAVLSAKEILARVKEEVERGNILPTRVGIGLHAGNAVTGSIGSALRREYTVIGDVVNLASRIEKMNKQFGSQLLVSETVSRAAEDVIGEAISKGTVSVRGREESIQIFQLA